MCLYARLRSQPHKAALVTKSFSSTGRNDGERSLSLTHTKILHGAALCAGVCQTVESLSGGGSGEPPDNKLHAQRQVRRNGAAST